MSVPFICNNVTERKLIDFRKDCLELTFTKASDQNLTTLLNRICKAEKIKLDAEAKELVIEYSQQDYRRLVNYLQSLDNLIMDHSQTMTIAEIEQCNYIIGEKTNDMGLEESICRVLSDPNMSPRDSLRIYNNHKSQFICSIYDNYHHILSQKNHPTDPLARVSATSQIMMDIAWSDIIDKLMHKNQLWYLHRIHGLLSSYLPIQYLKADNPKNPNITLYTSTSRSKFNQQRNNEKDLYMLSSGLTSVTGTTDVHTLSQIILHKLLDEESPDNFAEAVAMLKHYGMDHTYVRTLYKIDRLSPHPKIPVRIENALREAFKVPRAPKPKVINSPPRSYSTNNHKSDDDDDANSAAKSDDSSDDDT